MKNDDSWNVLDLFKTFRNDKELAKQNRAKSLYSEVNREPLLFIDNQWILFNYPRFHDLLDTNNMEYTEILCVGIMRRLKLSPDKEDELIIVATSDIGEPVICYLENISSYRMLVIPTNNNYNLNDFCIYTHAIRELLDIHKELIERFWNMRPGLKPNIVDTKGEVKPLNSDNDETDMNSEHIKNIQESLRQNIGIFPVQIVNPETNKTKTIQYYLPLDFFDNF